MASQSSRVEKAEEVRPRDLKEVLRPHLLALAKRTAMAVMEGKIRAGDMASSMDVTLGSYIAESLLDIEADPKLWRR